MTTIAQMKSFCWQNLRVNEERASFSPHLSDPGLRQRSLPSSGAVLDVTGGGESEESQEGQEERGMRHGSWSPGADVPPSPGRMADCCPLVQSPFISAGGPPPLPFLTLMACPSVLLTRHPMPRLCAWRASAVSLHQMCAIKQICASAADDASSVFRAAPRALENNFFGIIRSFSGRAGCR